MKDKTLALSLITLEKIFKYRSASLVFLLGFLLELKWSTFTEADLDYQG